MLSERDSLHIPTMRQTEDARRLDRYDRAVELLGVLVSCPTSRRKVAEERVLDFLSEEPKEGEGGR